MDNGICTSNKCGAHSFGSALNVELDLHVLWNLEKIDQLRFVDRELYACTYSNVM